MSLLKSIRMTPDLDSKQVADQLFQYIDNEHVSGGIRKEAIIELYGSLYYDDLDSGQKSKLKSKILNILKKSQDF